MPQTLFAVLALGLATLFSLNTNRARLDRVTATIAGTLEVEARGVAEEVLNHIGGHDFDEFPYAESPTEFTPEKYFGAGERGYNDPTLNDVDDFHGVAIPDIIRGVSTPDTGEQVPLLFGVEVKVQYVIVSDTGVVSSGGTRTYDKQVIVTVSNDHLNFLVSLSRVMSYHK